MTETQKKHFYKKMKKKDQQKYDETKDRKKQVNQLVALFVTQEDTE